MKYTFALFCILLFTAGGIHSQTAASSEDNAASFEQRLRIIRYGTDTEIANLIKTLRNEQAEAARHQGAGNLAGSSEDSGGNPLDGELLLVAEKTRNRAILSGVFSYFGDREKPGLEQQAVRAIEERDYEAAETVNAAIDYLGKIRAAGVSETLKAILDGEETRFLSGAIRALGKAGEKDNPGGTAEYLIDYYTNREPGDENRRFIVLALGDLKAKEGTAFLVSIAENEDERAPMRIAAAESLAKIADPDGLAALVAAASSRDPNVRSSAVGSLGPFQGETAEAVIIEAFRDSYYRTRLAAAKAAGERKLAAAVPFLRFRAENDDVPAVRDEAVKALGAIGGSDSLAIVEALFKERKNTDRIRINSGEILLSHDKYAAEVITEMDYAKSKNQTALYNGFLRILGNAKAPELESLARRFFASGGVIEKSYALDICGSNDFRTLAAEVRKLADPKNGSLSRKSLALLEKWGLPVEETAAAEAVAGGSAAAEAAEPSITEVPEKPDAAGAAGSSPEEGSPAAAEPAPVPAASPAEAEAALPE